MDKHRTTIDLPNNATRSGASVRRVRRLASIPKRLIPVTGDAMAAYATQLILEHSDRLPVTDLSNWIGPTPAPIAEGEVGSWHFHIDRVADENGG